MFGLTMKIEGITLRAFRKEDLSNLTRGFASLKVHMWTSGLYAPTLENEQEWYDNNRQSKTDCLWAIQSDGNNEAIGVTGIHGMHHFGTCSSGIIIWDPEWWGKGVAGKAHLGRTLFAADYLNRLTISSSVRTENEASLKALLRVGYTKWGIEPRTGYRQGRWIDTYHLTWLHPERVEILFPEGLPDQYQEGVTQASKALAKARRVVVFP